MASARKPTPHSKPGSKPSYYEALKADYVIGVMSNREMARKYSVSHAQVAKLARAGGWKRDLTVRIHKRADELVARAQMSAASGLLPDSPELSTVLAAGAMLAAVRLEHREVIREARKVALGLLGELRLVCNHPELSAMIWDCLSLEGDKGQTATLIEMASFVVSLPLRTKVMKDISDTLRNIIGMEREAFGLDTTAGSDGRPTVIVRDYTGRGDPDSPRAAMHAEDIESRESAR